MLGVRNNFTFLCPLSKHLKISVDNFFLHFLILSRSPTAVLDNLSAYKNFYNLSMTYRLDSDIEFDYGKVIDIKTNEIIAPAVNPKWRTPDENFYGKSQKFKLNY